MRLVGEAAFQTRHRESRWSHNAGKQLEHLKALESRIPLDE